MCKQDHCAVPQLETARTRMRGHVLSDFDASAALWGDARVVRYISGVPSTTEKSWSRLLSYIGHWQLMGFGFWVVEDRVTGEFLGEVGLADHKRGFSPALQGLPEIGWVLTPAASGRGLATETAAAAVQWADKNLSQKETMCIFDPEHRASIRVAEKNGYRGDEVLSYQEQPTLVMRRTASQ